MDIFSNMHFYASKFVRPFRSTQNNLRIETFAIKHNLTIEEVESVLSLNELDRKEWVVGYKNKWKREIK